MRFLFSFLILTLGSPVQAQYDQAPMTFRVTSTTPGCVTVDSISTSTDFPNLPGGQATQLRFFYSTMGADKVTQDSPYGDSIFEKGDYDQWTLTTKDFCGFSSGRTYFKYGLIDSNNNLLHFMTDAEYDGYSNAVDVK